MTQRLTLEQAAAKLNVPSPRWLAEWLNANPRDPGGELYFTPVGRNKIFREDDVARIREALLPMLLRPTFVYFVEQESFIKIGISDNWRKRLASIQTASPFLIRRLLVIRSMAGHEAELHRKFAAHHVRGEWFRDCEPIRKTIEVLHGTPLFVIGEDTQ